VSLVLSIAGFIPVCRRTFRRGPTRIFWINAPTAQHDERRINLAAGMRSDEVSVDLRVIFLGKIVRCDGAIDNHVGWLNNPVQRRIMANAVNAYASCQRGILYLPGDEAVLSDQDQAVQSDRFSPQVKPSFRGCVRVQQTRHQTYSAVSLFCAAAPAGPQARARPSF